VVDGAAREVRRLVAEMIRGASAVTDIDALLPTVEKVRDAVKQKAPASIDPHTALSHAAVNLRALRKLIESETASDPAGITSAINQLRTAASTNRDAGLDELAQRIERARQPFVAAVEEAQRVLDAAIQARKPGIELAAALEHFEKALDRNARLRTGQDPPGDTRTIVQAYRTMIRAFDPETDPAEAMQKLREARANAKQFGGRGAAAHEALFAKWEREIAESATTKSAARLESIRSRVVAAKDPIELRAIADELVIISAKGSGRNQGADEHLQLANQLNLLAIGWRTANPGFVRSRLEDPNASRTLFSKELSELQARIEREVLSRTLRAPQLLAAPLAEKPLDVALDLLSDELVSKGEWRRLYHVAEARVSMRTQAPRQEGTDLLSALRSFLAGQNFELAEQWTEAAQAYKAVLRNVHEHAPVSAAAERLKVLSKEHPDAVKTAAPVPYGVSR
jgi:hypothetical protein